MVDLLLLFVDAHVHPAGPPAALSNPLLGRQGHAQELMGGMLQLGPEPHCGPWGRPAHWLGPRSCASVDALVAASGTEVGSALSTAREPWKSHKQTLSISRGGQFCVACK